MLLSDFIDALQAVLLLRLKMAPGDAARLMSDHSNKLEHWYTEGYAPIEAAGEMVGRELSENYDVRTGKSILTQLVVDDAGKPSVVRVG